MELLVIETPALDQKFYDTFRTSVNVVVQKFDQQNSN